MNRIRTWIGLALLGALPSLGGCNLLKVEAPGHITDTSLDKPDAFPSLVNGMAFDLAQANDNVAEIESMASGEVWHGGSYDWGKIPRGIILPEDVDGAWSGCGCAGDEATGDEAGRICEDLKVKADGV